MGSPCSPEPTEPPKQGMCNQHLLYLQLSVMHADMQLLMIVQQLLVQSTVC